MTDVIAFIQSHGNPVVDNGDGTLTVTSEESRLGIVYLVNDTIPAAMAAARELLGY